MQNSSRVKTRSLLPAEFRTQLKSFQNSRPSTCGFTLIEIMIVLVIVAIVATIGFISFANMGRGESLEDSLNTLSYRIQAAELEAVLSPALLRISITHNGYRFSQWVPAPDPKDSRWQPLSNDTLSNLDAFPRGATLKLSALNDDDKTPTLIAFTPNAMVTPFKLTLQRNDKTAALIVSENGNIAMQAGGAHNYGNP